MLAQRSLFLWWLIYYPVCASKEGGLFLYGAATPPVQEGKFAGRHIFLGITRTGSKAGGWQTFAATRLKNRYTIFPARRARRTRNGYR